LCSEAATAEQLSICDAVIAGGEQLTRNVLRALPRLRAIARAGVGCDRVDVTAATELGIPVTITPTANYDAVAEHTLALLFAVAKSIVAFDRSVRTNWRRWLTMPVRGTTLGLLGLGRIGRAVAVRGKSLGMTVIAEEPDPDLQFTSRHGIELVDRQTLLANSDYLSVHCPLTTETERMIDRTWFRQMKPGSVFINTARGRLVVEADLIEALQSGHLRAAGLDVLEQEPPDPGNPLLKMDNVVLTPHNSGEDALSSLNMGLEAARCVVQLYRGQWPEGCVVNDTLRPGWKW
jgi:phosphoglycerate dehydrogenase-like enzyme